MNLKPEVTIGERAETGTTALEPSIGCVAETRGQSLDSIRPRVLTCKALLHDAGNVNLSLHARIRLGFECIYFCCLEVAASTGAPVDTLVHPSFDILDAALPALKLSGSDSVTVDLLLHWSQSGSPFVPAVPVLDVCDLANRSYDATLRCIGFV
ncbi:hypothetical protein BGLT_03557 [Caballeronia glathei]|uniref:Uncharacterized protein n=1 Tax=Caballeronia glathei TaxID=60547 RepID=A0A069PTM3_9BURK|nr:hypothetical protein [Caballeronia glathei]KDR40626.1 hypothetical protein BG61_24050 [Caballeronia glathei]CDY74615.1 hypothetical protein BGLT_03557 [Caballeronia glathei]